VAATSIPARDRANGVVAGVAAGLGRALGVDPTLVRLLFAILTLAGGAGVALYLAAALLMRNERGARPSGWRVVVGAALVVLAAIVALNGLGLPGFVQAAAAAAAVGVFFLVRRQKRLVGWALVAAAAAILLTGGGDVGTDGPLLTPAALAGGLLLVIGPWLWRAAQERDAERTARIRSEERAEVAARVHDSVLQTLALIQKSSADPRRVAGLARRQERELRGWLFGAYGEGSLVAAIEDAATEIEELHDVRIEVASAGNAPLDDDLRALVLATREAMVNAAKFANTDEVSVYVEVDGSGASVFVRDRGAGFERGEVPAERRGLAESIEGRMTRHGGTATITSAPGAGTEVELTLPRDAR
jgi:signal transduction histidine kinase